MQGSIYYAYIVHKSYTILINYLSMWSAKYFIIYDEKSQQGLPNRMPGYHLFMLGYQKLSIFVSQLSSPVARKVIWATKHNNDLSTPGQDNL